MDLIKFFIFFFIFMFNINIFQQKKTFRLMYVFIYL